MRVLYAPQHLFNVVGDHRNSSVNNLLFLYPASMLFRYDLVSELNRNSNELLTIMNKIAYYFGVLGAVGTFLGELNKSLQGTRTLVANFQETAVIQVHLTGAFLSFGFGCAYVSFFILVPL